MNICLDCNSTYDRPGTCNCFAPGGKRAAQTITTDGTGPDVVVPYTTWIPAPYPPPYTLTVTATPKGVWYNAKTIGASGGGNC